MRTNVVQSLMVVTLLLMLGIGNAAAQQAPAQQAPAQQAPAAPPSDCISTTFGTPPHTLVRPCVDQESASSPIVEDGVIG